MSDLYMSYKTLEANENHFKTCTKCGETLPATTEYFYKHKNGKYGLESICKKCKSERHKQWRENNKDKILGQRNQYYKQWREDNKDKIKQYYEDNKDKILKQQEQYYKDNKDKRAEYHKQYRESNKDKIAEQKKQYRKDNKDKIKQYYEDNKDKHSNYMKQWYENNKDKVRKRGKQYRSTVQGQIVKFNSSCKRRTKEQNQGNGITKDQWLEMMNFFNWKCAYSSEVLSEKGQRSIDHIKPLVKGGEHEVWNIVPMYRPYNSSKRDKDMEEWYQEQDFYSEERLQKIYEWQEYAYNKYSKK